MTCWLPSGNAGLNMRGAMDSLATLPGDNFPLDDMDRPDEPWFIQPKDNDGRDEFKRQTAFVNFMRNKIAVRHRKTDSHRHRLIVYLLALLLRFLLHHICDTGSA